MKDLRKRKAAQQARGLLDQKEVLNRLGIARSTFYIMLEKGEFVQPIRLSARVHVWKETDIDDFMEQKIKDREPVLSNIEPTSNDGGQAQKMDAQHSEIEQLKAERKAASVNMNPSLMAHSMTLRDWFAGQALAGALADSTRDSYAYEYAESAYEYADAMLAAREVKR